jgi:excisionase family DNA binding protein
MIEDSDSNLYKLRKVRKNVMYLTIKETAEYLSLPESYIESLVQQRKIRAVHDGEQYLLYRDQFNQHLEQMEKMKRQLAEYLSEPIPEDIDVKDED